MTPLTLHITGMSCGHCLNTVNRSLAQLPGVQIRSVQIGRASLEYDEARIAPPQIVAAVTDAGYSAVAAPPSP